MYIYIYRSIYLFAHLVSDLICDVSMYVKTIHTPMTPSLSRVRIYIYI